jgi:hypothetical protein
MAEVILFHHALGVTDGGMAFADQLRDGVKGSKTLASSQAASPGDARAHGISEGRSEESIGPFLCELPRVCEDDRDLGVAHL